MLLLLHRTAPPLGRKLRAAWYEGEAVARASAETLIALWRRHFAEPAPCARTVRRHLAWAESAGLVAIAPGAGVGPTVHLIVTADEARWWARTGARLMRRNPTARSDRDAWYAVFGRWRAQALEFADRVRRFQAWLREGAWRARRAEVARAASSPTRSQAAGVADALREAVLDEDRRGLWRAIAAAGIRIRSGWRFLMRRQEERLRYAVAYLLEQVRRRGWPGDPAAFLVWAWRKASGRGAEALSGLRKAAARTASKVRGGISTAAAILAIAMGTDSCGEHDPVPATAAPAPVVAKVKPAARRAGPPPGDFDAQMAELVRMARAQETARPMASAERTLQGRLDAERAGAPAPVEPPPAEPVEAAEPVAFTDGVLLTAAERALQADLDREVESLRRRGLLHGLAGKYLG